MIKVFYRQGGGLNVARSLAEFSAIGMDKVLWIDLLSVTGDEKRAVEAFIGETIQSKAEAEEIESSSRFSEEGRTIFANTNFLSPAGDEMSMETVSFILSSGMLVTLRENPIRSFDLIQNKIMAMPDEFEDGFTVFVEIMEKRVDLDADIVELISKDVGQYSKRLSQDDEDVTEEFLLDINQMQENAMAIRENIVDKQRLVSNIVKSKLCPKDKDVKDDLGVILQDIASLINHINFTFERLEYLQGTVVGIINLDQNRIMKIFTFVSLLLMPATLVASFYGMNVTLPLGSKPWAWGGILLLMVFLIVGIWLLFKRKKML